MMEYSNADMARAIDEYVHNAKYREILKDKLIDGLSYKEIADKGKISERHAWTIVCRFKNKFFDELSKKP